MTWISQPGHAARSPVNCYSLVRVQHHNIPWDSQYPWALCLPAVSLETLLKSVRLTGNPWDLTGLPWSALLCEVSFCTSGRVTVDQRVTERSSLLKDNMLFRGDAIMSDRRIRVQDLFACKDVQVNTSTMMKGQNQLDGHNVVNDLRIACKSGKRWKEKVTLRQIHGQWVRH